MKRAFAAALALLVTSSAMAADLGAKKPSPAPAFTAFSWTGAYVGVEAGYLAGAGRYSIPAQGVATSPDPSGFVFGGFAGYRYQLANQVVLGAEVRAFGVTPGEGTRHLIGAGYGAIDSKWGGDARVSVGYAIGRFLPYVAAGVAVAEQKGCLEFADGSCFSNTRYSGTRIGLALSAGVAYAFTANWSARLDYTLSMFGNHNYTTTAVIGRTTRVRMDTHAVRAGLSYKF